MSAGTILLLFILGFAMVTIALACLWAVVDNRWIYKRRADSGDEQRGVAAPDSQPEANRRTSGGGH